MKINYALWVKIKKLNLNTIFCDLIMNKNGLQWSFSDLKLIEEIETKTNNKKKNQISNKENSMVFFNTHTNVKLDFLYVNKWELIK